MWVCRCAAGGQVLLLAREVGVFYVGYLMRVTGSVRVAWLFFSGGGGGAPHKF